jgi:hypothetical protein
VAILLGYRYMGGEEDADMPQTAPVAEGMMVAPPARPVVSVVPSAGGEADETTGDAKGDVATATGPAASGAVEEQPNDVTTLPLTEEPTVNAAETAVATEQEAPTGGITETTLNEPETAPSTGEAAVAPKKPVPYMPAAAQQHDIPASDVGSSTEVVQTVPEPPAASAAEPVTAAVPAAAEPAKRSAPASRAPAYRAPGYGYYPPNWQQPAYRRPAWQAPPSRQ